MGSMWRTGAVALVGLLACGGGAGGTGGGAGEIALADLPARALEVVCAYGVRCGRFPDRATCLASTPQDYGQLTADVTTGRSFYDGAAAADCLAAAGSASCSDFVTSPASCQSIFKGHLSQGANCFSGAECLSGLCGFTAAACPANVCCPGSCTAVLTPVAAGSECSAPGSVCAEGTFCGVDGDGATPRCLAAIGEGGACRSTSACGAGLVCHLSSGGNGACAKRPAQGEACEVSRFPCFLSTDVCDSTSSTCVPAAKVGAACQSNGACLAYARCDATTMTCVARGGVDAACTTTADTCLETLSCVAGRCALPPANPVCPAT
jgi:hypothetical protein